MKLKDAKISILFSEEGLHIKLYDNESVIKFCNIRLNKEQTCEALARMFHTPCTMEVFELENVGKRRVSQPLEFEIHDRYDKELLEGLAKECCPEGWTPNLSFNSQGSFYRKNDIQWARTICYKWVDIEEEDENETK